MKTIRFLLVTHLFFLAHAQGPDKLILSQSQSTNNCDIYQNSVFTSLEKTQIKRIIQRLIERLSDLNVYIDKQRYRVVRSDGPDSVKNWLKNSIEALNGVKNNFGIDESSEYATFNDINEKIQEFSSLMLNGFIGKSPTKTDKALAIFSYSYWFPGKPVCLPPQELLSVASNNITKLEEDFEAMAEESVKLSSSQIVFRYIDSIKEYIKNYLPSALLVALPAAWFVAQRNEQARIQQAVAAAQQPLPDWALRYSGLPLAAASFVGLNILRFFKENLLDVPYSLAKQFNIERTLINILENIDNYWIALQGKVQAKPRHQIIKEPTFADQLTDGFEKQKNALQAVIDYMEKPEKYDSLGLTPEKTFLFLGLPYTGKSFLAEAMAGTINKYYESTNNKTRITFIEVSLADLLDANGILNAFKEAKWYQPSILFIDDLHLYKAKTGDALFKNFQHIKNELKNYPNTHVIIIGATTDLANIDPNFRKLFAQEIVFDLPDYTKRYNFFKSKLSDIYKLVFDDADIKAYALQTEGLNYHDMETIIKNSLRKISQKTFDERIIEQIAIITGGRP